MWRRSFVVGLVALSVSAALPRVGDAAPQEKDTSGRPQLHLDRLELPAEVPGRADLEKHLRITLQREARRANWGAGRDNRIEYRFSITTLETQLVDGLLRVHCSALGQLPGGQKARSDISFGGRPGERTVLVRRVVDTVARGVVARLAELERQRRGLQ